MKLIKNILIITALTVTSIVNSQPDIISVEISPSNPTIADSIYIIAQVRTGEVGLHAGIEVEDLGVKLIVHQCIIPGILLSVTDYYDTINLGTKSYGEYSVDFETHFWTVLDSCTPIDFNSESLSFSVGIPCVQHLSELVEVRDLLGRTTEDKPNTPLIYVYSDGTIERVFRIE